MKPKGGQKPGGNINAHLLPAYREFGRLDAKGFLSAVSLFEINWQES
jgi:hypothetical protein